MSTTARLNNNILGNDFAQIVKFGQIKRKYAVCNIGEEDPVGDKVADNFLVLLASPTDNETKNQREAKMKLANFIKSQNYPPKKFFNDRFTAPFLGICDNCQNYKHFGHEQRKYPDSTLVPYIDLTQEKLIGLMADDELHFAEDIIVSSNNLVAVGMLEGFLDAQNQTRIHQKHNPENNEIVFNWVKLMQLNNFYVSEENPSAIYFNGMYQNSEGKQVESDYFPIAHLLGVVPFTEAPPLKIQ